MTEKNPNLETNLHIIRRKYFKSKIHIYLKLN